VVRLLPPLIIEDPEITDAAERIERAAERIKRAQQDKERAAKEAAKVNS
jgi:acetylornithine/succinyldiaminopimelate/putrescine aminotransferase